MNQQNYEVKLLKKITYCIVGIILAIGIIGFWVHKAREATHLDDAVQNYEQYQEIYNTCVKLNTDLCNMKSVPDDDKMFEQFSKLQRINAIKTNLNRWVEDYNAKSKMWGRNLWKSGSLPYQLDNNQFSCNN